jgi:arylsulfatase A-like enzyme
MIESIPHRAFLVAFAVWIVLLAGSAWAATPSATLKPNVVLMFIDDMGYGDIGPFGNKVNQTPHLDRMAEEGMVLTQFYVANTACTPSRAALLTGTYAQRIGMDGGKLSVTFPGDSRGLNPNEITLAEMLRENGYATGCFGKWHLGTSPNSCPLPRVSTRILAFPTPMICGRFTHGPIQSPRGSMSPSR